MRLSRREAVVETTLADLVAGSTRQVVARQIEVGVDIGNDGEQGRESFFTYVQHRLTGLAGETDRPPFQDLREYPGLLERYRAQATLRVDLQKLPRIVGPLAYADRGPLEREVALLAETLAERPSAFRAAFLTAPSPGIIAAAMANDYYPSLEACVRAVGSVLQTEYEYIASQGLLLQIDCPDLAMERHGSFADRPLSDFLRFVESVVEAINQAVARIPREQVRLHVCWGNYAGPHTFDVPLAEILPLLYHARVGALVLPLANPRHAHEYHLFEQAPLPDEMSLVAGVIDTTTNYVEHPEVVAERLERIAQAIGDPRRLIAGTDCGFGSAAGSELVDPAVVWEKLRVLRLGADLAAERLR
jgi:5-methyltetrahydropteroyltriglutamate--homocysteine methyltransferase